MNEWITKPKGLNKLLVKKSKFSDAHKYYEFFINIFHLVVLLITTLFQSNQEI